MKTVAALVGMLGGSLVAIVAVSLYYVTRFKTTWSSFRTTVYSGLVGLALSLVLGSLLLWKILPIEGYVAPKNIKWYLFGFFLAGMTLGVTALARVLASVRDRERHKAVGEKESLRWYDVPPPEA